MKPKDKMTKTVLVIFGGTGDLSFRKLHPAWYNLCVSQELGDVAEIVALGRKPWDDVEYKRRVKQAVKEFSRYPLDENTYKDFEKRVHYYPMHITNTEDYNGLWEYLRKKYGEVRIISYLALAPQLFEPILDHIEKTLPASFKDKMQIVVEKPFGLDLQHAKKVFNKAATAFGEEQIYHIDHYLGKEMLINLLTLRFQNAIFKGAWGKDAIDFIEISAFEKLGVEGRASYYDETGAMKDMVQNHLFQVLSLVAMPEPKSFHWKDVTQAKQEILQRLKPSDPQHLNEFLCMGQYKGYLEEQGVKPDSKTETFVALSLEFDHPYWQGVPFLIRTGKKLKERETMVIVHYKKSSEEAVANKLMINIQPEEGIKLSFNIKRPGQTYDIMQAHMDFCQSCLSESAKDSPEAYERLLRAIYRKERELFSQWAEIEWAWKWVDAVHERWIQAGSPLKVYEQGSFGPPESCELVPPHCEGWFCEI